MLTGLHRQNAGQGFTLIELLLATVLLLLLLSATVFSFSGLQRGAGLDEGAMQFEALIRYARAQAASTGRQVRISFDGEADPETLIPVGGVLVTWEPDPLGQPGMFQKLNLAESYLEGINDLVLVESVRVSDPENSSAFGALGSQPEDSESESDFTDSVPPIKIYPDGTCDSAEIILSARDTDDLRRVAVRLVGITGAIRRQVIQETDPNEAETGRDEKATTAASTEKQVGGQGISEPAKSSSFETTGNSAAPQ